MGSGALLLDCDGTLAETERDGHRLAFNKAFKEPDPMPRILRKSKAVL